MNLVYLNFRLLFILNKILKINIIYYILDKPFVKLTHENFKIIYEELKIKNIHVSISHEDEYSVTQVLLE